MSSSSTSERFYVREDDIIKQAHRLADMQERESTFLVLGQPVGENRGRGRRLCTPRQDALEIVCQQVVILAALVTDYRLSRLQEGIPIASRTRFDQLSQEPSRRHDLVLYSLFARYSV